MASEDVIELGSSEDEAEPAPKKRKPMPNAMVHIPANIPGLTITPSKHVKNTSYDKVKGLLSKPIVVRPSKPIISNITKLKSKVPVLPQCSTNIGRVNANIVSEQIPANIIVSKKEANRELLINPICIANNLKQSQMVKKLLGSNILKNPFTQGSKILNKLPSSITITKTHPRKHVQLAGITGFNAKRMQPIIVMKKQVGVVPTVNLDEENTNISSSSSSHQWYMRPEESVIKNVFINDSIDNSETSMEEQNNKEPEVTKYVEITIEDSPIKNINNKLTSEVGRELPITIEDSPIKLNKNDSEAEVKQNDRMCKKIPQSKKKLDYPNDLLKSNDVVEIEIDSIETCAIPNNNDEENCVLTSKNSDKVSEDKEIDKDTEAKDEELDEGSSSTNQIADSPLDIVENGEFHPIYQAFIDTCFNLENTEDMKIIVEKKIKTYYKQSPKEYVESEEFIDMVSSKIASMKTCPEKMYLFIKDIVDELNLQRKMAKSEILNKEMITTETNDKLSCEEYSEYDFKKQRQVRKLEKTIKKLHRAIQKLEEQEVEFEDEDDSVYLLTERYKERMVRVHAKFCQLTNTKMPSEPRIVIDARIGRPPGPAKKLEKWINKKVPIGTPLPFPDFHDVVCCVREANEEDSLYWNEVDIMEEARDLFARCGKKLQRRRQENEWRIATSRISTDVDPAEISDELKIKLNTNKLIAAKRESEILNSFVVRQDQLKLEAEEIGDKEAEESPIESEDEEPNDSSSLGDKHKRKDRLRRLLLNKNKKVTLRSPSPTPSGEYKDESQTEVTIDNEKVSEENMSIGNEENKSDIDNKEVRDIHNEQTIHSNGSQTSNVDSSATTAVDVDELNNNEDKVETVSDSSIESDIDELHLLQKLHSENEANSSISESSDSDTPIAISDTLDSDSEAENIEEPFDVISIENSSYSESETNADVEKDNMTETDKNIESLVNASLEVEFTTNNSCPKMSLIDSNEDETENILLASSDEDGSIDKDSNLGGDGTCINLKDDTISISDTVIGAVGINEVRQIVSSIDEEAPLTDKAQENIENEVSTVEVSDVNLGNDCKLSHESTTDKDEDIEKMDCSEFNNSNDLENDETTKDK